MCATQRLMHPPNYIKGTLSSPQGLIFLYSLYPHYKLNTDLNVRVSADTHSAVLVATTALNHHQTPHC